MFFSEIGLAKTHWAYQEGDRDRAVAQMQAWPFPFILYVENEKIGVAFRGTDRNVTSEELVLEKLADFNNKIADIGKRSFAQLQQCEITLPSSAGETPLTYTFMVEFFPDELTSDRYQSGISPREEAFKLEQPFRIWPVAGKPFPDFLFKQAALTETKTPEAKMAITGTEKLKPALCLPGAADSLLVKPEDFFAVIKSLAEAQNPIQSQVTLLTRVVQEEFIKSKRQQILIKQQAYYFDLANDEAKTLVTQLPFSFIITPSATSSEGYAITYRDRQGEVLQANVEELGLSSDDLTGEKLIKLNKLSFEGGVYPDKMLVTLTDGKGEPQKCTVNFRPQQALPTPGAEFYFELDAVEDSRIPPRLLPPTDAADTSTSTPPVKITRTQFFTQLRKLQKNAEIKITTAPLITDEQARLTAWKAAVPQAVKQHWAYAKVTPDEAKTILNNTPLMYLFAPHPSGPGNFALYYRDLFGQLQTYVVNGAAQSTPETYDTEEKVHKLLSDLGIYYPYSVYGYRLGEKGSFYVEFFPGNNYPFFVTNEVWEKGPVVDSRTQQVRIWRAPDADFPPNFDNQQPKLGEPLYFDKATFFQTMVNIGKTQPITPIPVNANALNQAVAIANAKEFAENNKDKIAGNPYYFDVNKEQAETLLNSYPLPFLVRPSTTSQLGYALSYRGNDGKISHIVIEQTAITLQDLVNYKIPGKINPFKDTDAAEKKFNELSLSNFYPDQVTVTVEDKGKMHTCKVNFLPQQDINPAGNFTVELDLTADTEGYFKRIFVPPVENDLLSSSPLSDTAANPNLIRINRAEFFRQIKQLDNNGKTFSTSCTIENAQARSEAWRAAVPEAVQQHYAYVGNLLTDAAAREYLSKSLLNFIIVPWGTAPGDFGFYYKDRYGEIKTLQIIKYANKTDAEKYSTFAKIEREINQLQNTEFPKTKTFFTATSAEGTNQGEFSVSWLSDGQVKVAALEPTTALPVWLMLEDKIDNPPKEITLSRQAFYQKIKDHNNQVFDIKSKHLKDHPAFYNVPAQMGMNLLQQLPLPFILIPDSTSPSKVAILYRSFAENGQLSFEQKPLEQEDLAQLLAQPSTVVYRLTNGKIEKFLGGEYKFTFTTPGSSANFGFSLTFSTNQINTRDMGSLRMHSGSVMLGKIAGPTFPQQNFLPTASQPADNELTSPIDLYGFYKAIRQLCLANPNGQFSFGLLDQNEKNILEQEYNRTNSRMEREDRARREQEQQEKMKLESEVREKDADEKQRKKIEQNELDFAKKPWLLSGQYFSYGGKLEGGYQKQQQAIANAKQFIKQFPVPFVLLYNEQEKYFHIIARDQYGNIVEEKLLISAFDFGRVEEKTAAKVVADQVMKVLLKPQSGTSSASSFSGDRVNVEELRKTMEQEQKFQAHELFFVVKTAEETQVCKIKFNREENTFQISPFLRYAVPEKLRPETDRGSSDGNFTLTAEQFYQRIDGISKNPTAGTVITTVAANDKEFKSKLNNLDPNILAAEQQAEQEKQQKALLQIISKHYAYFADIKSEEQAKELLNQWPLPFVVYVNSAQSTLDIVYRSQPNGDFAKKTLELKDLEPENFGSMLGGELTELQKDTYSGELAFSCQQKDLDEGEGEGKAQGKGKEKISDGLENEITAEKYTVAFKKISHTDEKTKSTSNFYQFVIKTGGTIENGIFADSFSGSSTEATVPKQAFYERVKKLRPTSEAAVTRVARVQQPTRTAGETSTALGTVLNSGTSVESSPQAVKGTTPTQSPRIARLKQLKKVEEIKTAKDYGEDYSVDYNSAAVAITKGRREEQEDRISAGHLPDFSKLSKDDKSTVLRETFAELAEQTSTDELVVGATLLIGALDKKQLYVANAGDSVLFKATVDSNGEVKLEIINALHQPNANVNPAEFQRVTDYQTKNKVDDGIDRGRLLYLGSRLAVSRGIGDKYFEQVGYSHEPELHTTNCEAPPQGDVIFIAASDGLMDKTTEADLAKYLAENQVETTRDSAGTSQQAKFKSPSAIVQGLTDWAANTNESRDNISVGAMHPLDARETETQFMMVADGHGGVKTAQRIDDTFQDIIAAKIQAKLPQQEQFSVELQTDQTDPIQPRSIDWFNLTDPNHPLHGKTEHALYRPIQNLADKIAEEKRSLGWPQGEEQQLTAKQQKFAGEVRAIKTELSTVLNRLNDADLLNEAAGAPAAVGSSSGSGGERQPPHQNLTPEQRQDLLARLTRCEKNLAHVPLAWTILAGVVGAVLGACVGLVVGVVAGAAIGGTIGSITGPGAIVTAVVGAGAAGIAGVAAGGTIGAGLGAAAAAYGYHKYWLFNHPLAPEVRAVTEQAKQAAQSNNPSPPDETDEEPKERM